jgi:pyrimidine operon attenuation protein/uracil phosphoribosyltransferase
MPLTYPLPDANVQCQQLADLLRPQLRPNTALVGIFSGGAWIAERVAQLLGITEPVGFIDVSFYRDDYERIGLHPNVRPTAIPFDVTGRHIVLFDDVLQSGRTTRAAMNVLFDFGRPDKIELAVLADRGGRHLPVAPQYCVWPITPRADEVLILEQSGDQLAWRVGSINDE